MTGRSIDPQHPPRPEGTPSAPATDRSSGTAPPGADYAIGRVRDLFLESLDGSDSGRTVEMARHLVACRNPLPSATCVALGLPAGSSYGDGAQAVLARAVRDD